VCVCVCMHGAEGAPAALVLVYVCM
jgi:hypothetical protein